MFVPHSHYFLFESFHWLAVRAKYLRGCRFKISFGIHFYHFSYSVRPDYPAIAHSQKFIYEVFRLVRFIHRAPAVFRILKGCPMRMSKQRLRSEHKVLLRVLVFSSFCDRAMMRSCCRREEALPMADRAPRPRRIKA